MTKERRSQKYGTLSSTITATLIHGRQGSVYTGFTAHKLYNVHTDQKFNHRNPANSQY